MKRYPHTSIIKHLLPLLIFGIISILLIVVIRQYILAGKREGVIILPGGVTYTGRE